MFDLISLDARSAEPIIVLGLIGVGGYVLYKHMSQQQAATSTDTTTMSGYSIGQLEQLYLMQQLGMFSNTNAQPAVAYQSAPNPTTTPMTNTPTSSSNTGTATGSASLNGAPPGN